MEAKRMFFDPNISRKEELVKNHLSRQADKDAPPLFSLIEFNLCGLCNRKCVFCPRVNPKAFPNVSEHMPIERYEKVVADLKAVEFNGTILYSAFSEPLLYNDLETVIAISKRLCPNARIEIVTNGDLVTAETLSGLFGAGLTALSISMYDGPHQMERFKKLQKELALRDGQIIYRVRWLPPEEHFGITLSNRAGTLEIKDIGVAALKEPLKKACYYPFYQVLVDYDGAVLLCAHDWSRRLIAGNVNDQSILEIWNNSTFKKVRMSLAKPDRGFAPCSLCDAQGTLIGKDHFEKWEEYYEEGKRIKK